MYHSVIKTDMLRLVMSLQKPHTVTMVAPMFLYALEHPKTRLEITTASKTPMPLLLSAALTAKLTLE